MRRPGRLGWLTHDLTHRGVTAWALASVLLGFYFGLYLPAESRRVAWWLGLAAPANLRADPAALGPDAAMHLTVPGPTLVLVTALVVLAVSAVHAWFDADDHGLRFGAALRTSLGALGARVAGLVVGTAYLSLGFARVLDPVAVGGRHLLPAAGQAWPAVVVALLLGGCAVALIAGARWALAVRGDTAAMLRRLVVPLVSVYVAVLVLVYGTHVFDPARPAPAGERSLRAFGHLVYAALDSRWTLYGLVYTMAVTAGGLFVIGRYLHNRYQVVRTLVVMGVQSVFGFAVPLVLKLFAMPEYYLSYFWPLKIDAFYPDNILRNPMPVVAWSFLGSLVLVPVLGVFFGKRWYCSWVCGCGGLANTAGEPWRHLSQKGEDAWKFERVSIHTVLVLAVVTTVLVVVASWTGEGSRATGVWWGGHGAPGQYLFDPLRSDALVSTAAKARYYYGLVVTAVLSGAIGVGLYPLGGTRQWCRNFCPMAGLLGLVQKFGRYRIRVKADMCISCGMCTKYCEMGIDVRAYAQANESFTRASCVGCGMCAEVCPRGVLSLEQRSPMDAAQGHGLVQLRLRR